MCGIWGSSYLDDSNSQLEDIVAAVRALAHRGPDDYGYYHNQLLALAHTRLSIIDLSSEARQPMLSSGSRYIGVFNGELYGFEEHRERLKSKGVAFKSLSDSEVFLNLFAESGVDCFKGLSGEFAFIIYDLEKSKLYFGRDIHGVKPLFMKSGAGGIKIASEAKALLGKEGAVLDPIYIQRFLSGLIVPPKTAVKNVEHVLPGRLYCFDFSAQKLSWQNYDQLFDPSKARDLKGSEATQLVYESLRSAVKKRLRADVPVGAYLSGGLDSSLNVSFMKECGVKAETFTVGFEDSRFDETQVAARTSRFLGLKHHVVNLTQRNYMSSLKRSILAFESPIINTHGAAKNLLSELAAKHVKVVLSGEGADEWFGGYAYLRIQKIFAFNQRHPSLALNSLDLFHAREGTTAKGHLDGEHNHYAQLIAQYFGAKQPAALRRLGDPRHLKYFISEKPESVVSGALKDLRNYIDEDFSGWDNVDSDLDFNLWMGLRTDLLHYILSNVGDRQEMSNSIEGRTPFLDQDLVKLARKLSPDSLIKGLSEKNILKEIAKNCLPREISKKTKFAFFAPTEMLFSKQNQDELDSYIQIAQSKLDFLPVKRILKVLDMDSDHARKQGVLTALYSMGILVSHLTDVHMPHPRGYQLPLTPSDLVDREFNSKGNTLELVNYPQASQA